MNPQNVDTVKDMGSAVVKSETIHFPSKNCSVSLFYYSDKCSRDWLNNIYINEDLFLIMLGEGTLSRFAAGEISITELLRVKQHLFDRAVQVYFNRDKQYIVDIMDTLVLSIQSFLTVEKG